MLDIILLMNQDLLYLGCVLERGLDIRNWVDKYCALCRLGQNIPVVLSCFLNSLNVEWWMLARS